MPDMYALYVYNLHSLYRLSEQVHVCAYMYALYVCLICMPYMYALHVYNLQTLYRLSEQVQVCETYRVLMPYMYALYVCLICMPYMYAICTR